MVAYVKFPLGFNRPVQVSRSLTLGSVCSAAWVWVCGCVSVCGGEWVWVCTGGTASHLDNNLCNAKHYSGLAIHRR